MRIAVAGFMHESSTFSPLRTDRAAYADGKAELVTELLRQARAGRR